jgi:hypothetical protein
MWNQLEFIGTYGFGPKLGFDADVYSIRFRDSFIIDCGGSENVGTRGCLPPLLCHRVASKEGILSKNCSGSFASFRIA